MARTSTLGTTRTPFMGRPISPLMCCAICLADSTSTRPSLVLLVLDRLEDFRKGLFFGVTEILLRISREEEQAAHISIVVRQCRGCKLARKPLTNVRSASQLPSPDCP